MLVDIDNSIKEELNKNAELNKEEVKQKITKEILSSLKVDYFMGPTLLEQSFSYKLKDGTYRVFVLEWNISLYKTYVYNYLEVLNEDKI